jgi:hypothetical protein
MRACNHCGAKTDDFVWHEVRRGTYNTVGGVPHDDRADQRSGSLSMALCQKCSDKDNAEFTARCGPWLKVFLNKLRYPYCARCSGNVSIYESVCNGGDRWYALKCDSCDDARILDQRLNSLASRVSGSAKERREPRRYEAR